MQQTNSRGDVVSVQVVVRGRVQGVGYRWFVQDAATVHDVTGWVRNRRDGSVEAELHGTDADVQAVIDAMAHGPAGARVDGVTTAPASETAVAAFEIHPTS